MELDAPTALEHYLMDQHALGDQPPEHVLDELRNLVYWMAGYDRETKQPRYKVFLVDEWELVV